MIHWHIFVYIFNGICFERSSQFKLYLIFTVIVNVFALTLSVSNSQSSQMPIENLAKIFGPTVLGYSCADPDHHAILSETMVQKDVSVTPY